MCDLLTLLSCEVEKAGTKLLPLCAPPMLGMLL